MTYTTAGESEPVERLLKRFRKKCDAAGILRDFRNHRHFEPACERRKRRRKRALRELRKRNGHT